MDFEDLLRLVSRSDTIAIRTHENADADAMGSCLALKLILEEIGKRPIVIAPTVSKIGKVLIERSGQCVARSEPSESFDLGIFVDALPRPGVNDRELAVIDHHQGGEAAAAAFAFTSTQYASTSEMILEFAEYLMSKGILAGIKPGVAVQLLSGILADTSDLKLAVRSTLERIARISASSGVEIREVFTFLKTPLDPSLKMACLKGASRMAIKTSRGYIIATTQVSSFQGDVASSLIHLGADIAFAAGRKKKVLALSGRARMDLVGKGFNLAQIMQTVASRTGGEGGGHAGAAGLRNEGEPEDALRLCVAETKKVLRQLGLLKQKTEPMLGNLN